MRSNLFYPLVFLGMGLFMFIDNRFFIMLLISFIMFISSILSNLFGNDIYLVKYSRSLKRVKYSKSNRKYYTFIKETQNESIELYILESKFTHFYLIAKVIIYSNFDEKSLNLTIKSDIDKYECDKKKEEAATSNIKSIKDSYKKWEGVLTKEDKRDNTIKDIIK